MGIVVKYFEKYDLIARHYQGYRWASLEHRRCFEPRHGKNDLISFSHRPQKWSYCATKKKTPRRVDLKSCQFVILEYLSKLIV